MRCLMIACGKGSEYRTRGYILFFFILRGGLQPQSFSLSKHEGTSYKSHHSVCHSPVGLHVTDVRVIIVGWGGGGGAGGGEGRWNRPTSRL